MPDAKIPQPVEPDAATDGADNEVAKLVFPPADANIPTPPAGFVSTNGSDYFGLLPKRMERVVMTDAVTEIRRSPVLTDILGRTAPRSEEIANVLDAAAQWSTMRAQASQWDLYCRTQEGIAWTRARAMMARVKPGFNLAVKSDLNIGFEFTALRRLLNAASDVAHRAAATKREKKRKAAAEAAAKKERGDSKE